MDDDNLFDNDNAFDIIMNEETERKSEQRSGKSGCFGLLILLIIPAVAMSQFVLFH